MFHGFTNEDNMDEIERVDFLTPKDREKFIEVIYTDLAEAIEEYYDEGDVEIVEFCCAVETALKDLLLNLHTSRQKGELSL